MENREPPASHFHNKINAVASTFSCLQEYSKHLRSFCNRPSRPIAEPAGSDPVLLGPSALSSVFIGLGGLLVNACDVRDRCFRADAVFACDSNRPFYNDM
jgi:hypothetical protein